MMQTASTTFDPLATPFTSQYHPNDDHERTDAILEFAQETGLWGLPGAEREPEPEEYQEMIDVFYALNPQHQTYDQEDVFSEEEEEETDEEDEEETDEEEHYDDVTPHPDAVDYDQMFEFMEQQNLLNNTSDDVPDLIQQQEQPEPDPVPLRWEDITADMQDYALDVMAEEGRLEDEITDEYALSIWSSYVEDCWHQSRHSELNALAGQNELRGILPSTM